PVIVEVINGAVRKTGRKKRLPAQTEIHSEPRRQLPGVLSVNSHVVVAGVNRVGPRLIERSQLAGEKIGHPQACRNSSKTETSCGTDIAVEIGSPIRNGSAKAELMLSPDETHIIAELIGVGAVGRFGF